MLLLVGRIFLLVSFLVALPAAGQDSLYLRAAEEDSGNTRLLQVSVRTFAPSGKPGPLVHLVGVIHIADRAYYEELQKFLDAQHIVLYEGVKPKGFGNTPLDDAERSRITARRIRTLALLVARFRREHRRLPETIDELMAHLSGSVARIGRAVLRDTWDNPLIYSLNRDPDRKGPPFDIVSLGSDAAPGGDAHAADLCFSRQPPLTRREVSAVGSGLQKELAEALGLVFQLDAIDYDRPNWHNSDLSVDEVEDLLEKKGAGGELIFDVLDGSSFAARMASALLKSLTADEQMATMFKLVMIETLPRSDRMMRAQGAKEMGAITEVILLDRNQAVFADLRRTLNEANPNDTVAVFYGAGHMPDLEDRITRELAYVFREDRWYTAMRVDLSGIPGAQNQAEQIRRMMDSMFSDEKEKP
jgi:hypothetical protein